MASSKTPPSKKSTSSKLLDELTKHGVSESEMKTIIQQLRHPQPQKQRVERVYGGTTCRIGVVSDLHIGHKCFREDIFADSVKTFKREKVDEIYMPGDIIEGMSNRDGHIYELQYVGISEQLKHAADLLNQYGIPISAIKGNHDGWSMKKSNQGVDIANYLEDKVKDLKIIGDMEGEIKIGGALVKLTHTGGSAYALSYSMQKNVNGLAGGTKPNIIINGHIHKMLYMFYRNIHCLEAGTLEEQTEFMKMKGAPAMTGYWILDITHNKTGVEKFAPTAYPFYD